MFILLHQGRVPRYVNLANIKFFTPTYSDKTVGYFVGESQKEEFDESYSEVVALIREKEREKEKKEGVVYA